MRNKVITCPDCGGRGRVFPELEDGKKPHGGEESSICETCDGLGVISSGGKSKKGKGH